MKNECLPSAASLAESADSTSGSNGPECASSGNPRLIPMPLPSCASTGPACPTTETFAGSQGEMWSGPTCSAEDSPARTYPTPASGPGSAASAAGYGQSTPELLASYDPDSCSWRTSQLCLDGGLSEFSETWPRSGIAVSGTAYRLPPLVPLTGGIGSGLWRTPTAEDAAEDAAEWDFARNSRGEAKFSAQVKYGKGAMWPTPTSRDWRSESCSPEFQAERDAETRGKTLPWVAGGSLNPTWVEALMGYPVGFTDLSDGE